MGQKQATKPTFKIMSLNVRGIAEEKKRRAIFDKHRIHADMLILFETHSTPECELIWANEWGGKVIYSHGARNSRGTTVFLTKKVQENITNIHKDTEGRMIIFDIKQNNQTVTITAIYAPNDDKPEFFKTMTDLLRNRSEHNKNNYWRL